MWKILFLAVLLTTQSHPASVSQTPKKVRPPYEIAAQAISAGGIRLQFLEDPDNIDNNFIISPFSSVLMALQAMLGADEQFREELNNLMTLPNSKTDKKQSVIGYYDRYNKLHVDFDVPYASLHLEMGNFLRELQRSNGSKYFNLKAANGIFVNSDVLLKDKYVHNLKLYKTYIRSLNFRQNPLESQTVINNWASKQTNNFIDPILARPPSPTDSAIFASVVYFKADWKTPFSYELTNKGDFHMNKNRTLKVEYMRGFIEQISYVESTKLGCKMIGLPYKGDEMVMYIVLLDESNGSEYNIKQFSTSISSEDIAELINKSKKHDVHVQIPKMKLTRTISFLKRYQKFKIFSNLVSKKAAEKLPAVDAEPALSPQETIKQLVTGFLAFETTESLDLYLTDAAENATLTISDLLQQFTLSVDEKGTDATAVSAPLVNYSRGSKNFKINRPFLLFIRHVATSTNLVWATIVNPVQKE